MLIPLANHLDWRQLQSNEISVKLVNGMDLPDWLQFIPSEKALLARKIPLGSLPLQLMVRLGELRYLVDIRESELGRSGQ